MILNQYTAFAIVKSNLMALPSVFFFFVCRVGFSYSEFDSIGHFRALVPTHH